MYGWDGSYSSQVLKGREFKSETSYELPARSESVSVVAETSVTQISPLPMELVLLVSMCFATTKGQNTIEQLKINMLYGR